MKPKHLLAAWLGLALLSALALPTSARAQYVTIETEHDWTVVVGEQRFGLQQSVVMPGPQSRFTAIYFGPMTMHTKLQAGVVAGLAGVALVAIIALLVVSVGRLMPKSSPSAR